MLSGNRLTASGLFVPDKDSPLYDLVAATPGQHLRLDFSVMIAFHILGKL